MGGRGGDSQAHIELHLHEGHVGREAPVDAHGVPGPAESSAVEGGVEGTQSRASVESHVHPKNLHGAAV